MALRNTTLSQLAIVLSLCRNTAGRAASQFRGDIRDAKDYRLYIAERNVGLTVDMLSFGLRSDSKWLILHILRLPFVLYENLCVHIDEITGPSREFSADRFAAETVGSAACAGVIRA